MKFKGFQKESLIEWPGKICAVVFVGDCNFRCPYCHNRDLVLRPEKLPDIDEREILDYLKENKNLLDGLIITGGEPLKNQKSKIKNQNDKLKFKSELIDFIKKVKSIGLKAGVETNGSFPEVIFYLIKNKLIDYIAMDIKTSLREKRYEKAAGVKVDLAKIKKSIGIIMNCGIRYEFKTTAVPGIVNKNDILKIANEIKGAKRYVLQQFQPKNTLEKKFEKVKPYPEEWFESLAQKTKKYLTNIDLRI